MPYKDKEKQRTFDRDWHKKHRDQRREYDRRLREKVLILLGGKCINCGCDEFEVLEINHKNGGGRKERYTNRARQFYLHILNGTRKTDDLELTCIICNAYHKAKVLRKAKSNWKIIWIS